VIHFLFNPRMPQFGLFILKYVITITGLLVL
jgi:hypothetical protein